MVACRWNELAAVWEVQDTDTPWIPLVPDAWGSWMGYQNFQQSFWRLIGCCTRVEVYEFNAV